jgi:hypothetical protein
VAVAGVLLSRCWAVAARARSGVCSRLAASDWLTGRGLVLRRQSLGEPGAVQGEPGAG